jgi:hypothetical protein
MTKAIIKTTLVATVTLAFTVSAQAAGLWVFGDSLSGKPDHFYECSSERIGFTAKPKHTSSEQHTISDN